MPNEILDICNANGTPTGNTVPRSDAHKMGVCHRTAHVWIYRRLPQNSCRYEVLLQRRSCNKDSYPGCLDTSSAGHIPAGSEPAESAIRELHEELGISINENNLKFLGITHTAYEKVFHDEIFRDNEVVFVYACTASIELSAITIQETELESVGWYDMEHTIQCCKNGDPEYCIPLSSLLLLQDFLKDS